MFQTVKLKCTVLFCNTKQHEDGAGGDVEDLEQAVAVAAAGPYGGGLVPALQEVNGELATKLKSDGRPNETHARGQFSLATRTRIGKSTTRVLANQHVTQLSAQLDAVHNELDEQQHQQQNQNVYQHREDSSLANIFEDPGVAQALRAAGVLPQSRGQGGNQLRHYQYR